MAIYCLTWWQFITILVIKREGNTNHNGDEKMYVAITVNNEVVAVVDPPFVNDYMAGHQGPGRQLAAFPVKNDIYIGYSHGVEYRRQVVDIVGGQPVSVAVEV